MPSLIDWTQYLAARSVLGFMQMFNIDQNLRTAAAVGSLIYASNAKRRRRAVENIAHCFPEWSPERIELTAKRSMEHMLQIFVVDGLVMPRLVSPMTWANQVHFNGIEPVLDILVRGQPVILLTGHIGNWELLGFALAVIGYPLVALARPLDNPLINDWIMGMREARGLRIVTKWGATPILQETIRDGGRVGFIADQNAGDQGLFVPFFGRLASCYKSIGLLAMRYNVPIACGCAMRRGEHFEYEIFHTDLIRPDEWSHQPDPLFYITARYARAIEMMIRRCPEQYLWVHRRWKSRPRHEREGEPMPARLIEKIEQLPWMTQRERDRIVLGGRSEAGEGVKLPA